jgi:hypothetical protein
MSTESEADAGLAPNKRAGVNVEDLLIADVDELDAAADPDAHYDAVCSTALFPSTSLPFVAMCVLERGTHVEIKSALHRYTSGARGRFHVRPTQHRALLEDSGSYLFAVCERPGWGDDREVLALKVVPATVVDDLLPEWFDGGEGREDYAQLSWGRLFRPEEVSDGE